MMEKVLKIFFSSVSQADKDAVRHLRQTLVGTHATYQSVVFDIMELTASGDRQAIAEMAFLIGMQAGYELGVSYPPPKELS